MSSGTASQRLAVFASGLRARDLPEAVVAAAKLHALDALGCGLAACGLSAADFVTAAALEGGATGPATAIGVADGLSPGEAALVNGTLCHALDYDDTHPGSVVHVSAAVTPAALAAAQAHGADGETTLVALVAGNEVSIRLGMSAGGRFHARGLHPTGVCGVFGAAATAARVRGLDADRSAHALGLAGSMAGGLLEFLADGSKTKPLHPGLAARAGLSAAALAAHGATGPASVFEGRRGLFAAYLHGEPVATEHQVADLGERWETPRIAIKPYPACHYAHAPVDALAELIDAEGINADDIDSIVALSDETGVGMVLDPLADKLRPRTPYDAKFSLPYCLASRLVHGELGVSSFTPEAIADPAVLDVAARVTYELKQYAPAPDAFPGGVRVTTRDGRTLEAELRHQRGSADSPIPPDEVIEKYRANAGLALAAEETNALERLILDLDASPDLAGLQVLAAASADG